MEYINKHDEIRIKDFNELIDSFIAQDLFHYKDLDNSQRNQIREFLRIEQNSFCAYCMQKDMVGSVEHVIAQHISKQDFGRAIRCGNFFPQFIYQKNFAYSSGTIQYYPHTLAYGNLVYSCTYCNQKKGREIIHPNFFNYPTDVFYKVDGKAVFPKDSLSLEMKSYLNEDVFRRCRIFWSAVKKTGKTIADVKSLSKKKDRRKLLQTIIPQMPQYMQSIFSGKISNFCSDVQWKLLVSYEWFWGVTLR